jgi:hypothetical protein
MALARLCFSANLVLNCPPAVPQAAPMGSPPLIIDGHSNGISAVATASTVASSSTSSTSAAFTQPTSPGLGGTSGSPIFTSAGTGASALDFTDLKSMQHEVGRLLSFSACSRSDCPRADDCPVSQATGALTTVEPGPSERGVLKPLLLPPVPTAVVIAAASPLMRDPAAGACGNNRCGAVKV